MADKGGSRSRSASPGAAPELLLDTPIGSPLAPQDFEPLVTALGGGILDFGAMLAMPNPVKPPAGRIP